jgi:hypothetical protein
MSDNVKISGRDGLVGTIESEESDGRVRVRFDQGESVVLPPGMVQRNPDGTASVPLGRSDLFSAAASGTEVIIPVVEERLEVRAEPVETGRVAVYVVPHEHEQIVRVPLTDEHVEVERVEVNRFVDAPEPVRQEGDVTIVPVMEEVLIVQKRLRVKHELRLTRRRQTRDHEQRVALRSEEARVLRSPAPEVPPAANSTPSSPPPAPAQPSPPARPEMPAH